MKNILALICFVAVIVAFFGLWGTMGALEQDIITFGTSVRRSAIFIAVLVIAGIGLWKLEKEGEYI